MRQIRVVGASGVQQGPAKWGAALSGLKTSFELLSFDFRP